METSTDTPDLILDAAEELFARQGFAATTIKQIGAAAGANPALIYYYFRSKEGLYRALLERLFAYIAERAVQRLEAGGAPGDAVGRLVELQSEVLTGRPALPRLLARELVDHHAAHAEGGLAKLSATAFARLRELIRAGQEAGVFRRDMDPAFAAVSVVSLVPYFHIARPAVGILLGSGPEGPTPEQARAYGLHAARFALAALLARPAGETPTPEEDPDPGEGR